MVYDATLFNTEPYYDDFDEDKKFLRMLFRPGYAVQARELTQLQTVVQNQIKNFGDHMFNDGSRILGGEISNQDTTFIRINKTDNAGATVDVANFLGLDVTTNTNGDFRKARVIHGISADSTTDDNYYVLCLQYLNGGSGGVYGSQFTEGENISGVCGSSDHCSI